ncbi:VIT family protein [Aestuariivirga sp.]|uniref:VIT family protein n=1 Tax=Aestuariivirga sp. TaxID=2650926 RepID=UPI00359442AD
MPGSATEEVRKRVLNPVERLSEILFGLIMVLTFTGSLSVATAERADVREMLIGAIGCNLAWALIDAIMYLMACMSERGAMRQTVLAIRKAGSTAEAHEAISGQLPPLVAAELRHEDLERIRHSILALKPSSGGLGLQGRDVRGAIGVFLIVVASTFPVIVPFIFLPDAAIAMRLSNAIAIVMLAMIGFGYGKASGQPPLWMATAMVVLGVVLVSVTIALGG